MPNNKSSLKGPWLGRGLFINLAEGFSEPFSIPDKWGIEYLGGPGLAARLLYKRGNHADIVISPGLLTSLPAFTACKASICAISPLTGRWGESNLGGHWPVQIKKAGWDIIWIRGRSPRWTYITIENDTVKLEPADDLVGLSTRDCDAALRSKLGKSFHVACIGPASENGVLYGSIHADGRVSGRCGMGLDWAQRMIKAVAISGTKKIEPFDQEGLRKSVRAVRDQVRQRTEGLHKFGTAGGAANREITGDLPIKNFIQGLWDGRAQKITGQTLVQKYNGRPKACPQCPIACGTEITVPSLNYTGPMPEYETVGSLGSLLLIDDPEAVIAANNKCNELGMDTISTGVVVAFAIECCERGLIPLEEFAGLEPRWGSGEFLLGIIDMICMREGIGAVLAEGVKRAAEKIGGGAEDAAMHSGGLELPMHDPRAMVSLAPTYALSPRGASHNETMSYYVEQGIELSDLGYPDGLDPHKTDGKGRLAAVMQDISNVYDNLGLCKFMLVGGIGPTVLRGWLKYSTGWDKSSDELMQCGARTVVLKNLFNIDRLGIKPSAHLPKRILHEPRGAGQSADNLPDLDAMVKEYYAVRGWSEDGYPPEDSRPTDNDGD